MSPGSASQRGRPWLLVLVVLAVLAAAIAAVARGYYRDGPLEPDAPTGQGSRAAVSVLQDLDVEVDTQRLTADVLEDLAEDRTVLVTDPDRLSGAQLDALAAAVETSSGTLVLVQPNMVSLGYVSSQITPAGAVRSPSTIDAGPGCGTADFHARSIHVAADEGLDDGPASLYRTSGDAQGCFSVGDGSLVAVDGRVIVLGSPDLLTNDGIREADNAALVLNSLGGSGELTWYVPSSTDPMASTAPSILDHMPPWAYATALWLLIGAVIALIAAGRRFGPVVVEPLPVTVRPQELVLGRARLLQQSQQRDAAASSLRVAAARRLADRLGLSHEASLDPLLSALAPHVHRSPQQLRSLLGSTPVRSDQELVQLAHDLDTLEKEIDR